MIPSVMNKFTQILNSLSGYLRDEDGAVTVDWVVLTAGIIGIGIVAASSVLSNVPTLADKIGSSVSVMTVATW